MISFAANVDQYLGTRRPTERPASFDYCFNYFQGFVNRGSIPSLASPEYLELSCLHLGYYLASLGMLRGSTILYNKSYRFLQPTVELVARSSADLWRIDVDTYSDANVNRLLNISREIVRQLDSPEPPAPQRVATPTLVTKIMLGIFGSMPAFDRFFNLAFRTATRRTAKLDHATLRAIHDLYRENEMAINGVRLTTLDFATGRPSKIPYTKAKIIDMALVIAGGGSGY